jgi:hypothetical protein
MHLNKIKYYIIKWNHVLKLPKKKEAEKRRKL